MKAPRRYVRLALIVLAVVVALTALSGISLYADIQRIGCESAGQLLGPVSSGGYAVANASQPGACFVSFIALQGRDISISRVACMDDASFPSCQDYRKQVSSTWSTFFGTRCTSISFVGGATCGCTETGKGCQTGEWVIESER